MLGSLQLPNIPQNNYSPNIANIKINSITITKTLAKTGIDTNIEFTIFFMPKKTIKKYIKTYFEFWKLL